jgi:hypothetical protein
MRNYLSIVGAKLLDALWRRSGVLIGVYADGVQIVPAGNG